MEHRLTFTIADLGRDESAADRFLDAFLERAPETGPVVGINAVTHTLDVTFALDADDAEDALDRGRAVLRDGHTAAGVFAADVRVVGIQVERVPADELEPDPTLEPA